MSDEATQNRHESHFVKIFESIDEFRNNYVRSPTFVISLLTIVFLVAGTAGWQLNQIYSRIYRNEVSVIELARQQVRLEEKQYSLEKTQDQTITQLIEALKPIREN